MKRCATFDYGAHGHGFRRGFTLLEMCMVLFISMLLLALTMPAIQSVFVEQAVEGDAHELSLMVKTAMLQSAEQHRAYVIELTETTMALHPLGNMAPDLPFAGSSTNDDEDSDKTSTPDEATFSTKLDPPNQLLTPDPKKSDGWIAMPASSWVFQPGELCPATHVRLARGSAWVELSFNALTGNVENDGAYFP